MKPFLWGGSLTILLSLAVYLGLNLPLYAEDSEVLQQYSSARDAAISGFHAYSGIFLNQNTFGAALLIFLSSSILYFYNIPDRQKWKANIRILFIIMLTGFFFLILTMSRSAIFGMVLFFLFLAFSYFFSLKFIKYLLLMAGFLVLVLFLKGEYILRIIERTQEAGTTHRTTIWMDAYQQFLANPFFGVGSYHYDDWTAYNHFIQVLASDGIFVFSFVILFFLYFVFLAALKYKKALLNPSSSRSGVVLVATFAALLFHQQFETMLQSPFSPITLQMFLVMAFLLPPREKQLYVRT